MTRTRGHHARTRGSSMAGQNLSAAMQPAAIAKINITMQPG
jgi:hypothetical protein